MTTRTTTPKMTPKNRALRLASALVLTAGTGLLNACAGYSAAPGVSSLNVANSISGGNGKNPAGPVDPSLDAWNKLDVSGSVGGGRFNAFSVVSIDKTTNELVLSLPMQANPFLDSAQLSLQLPKFPGATVSLDHPAAGGTVLTLHVPLASIVKGVRLANPAVLPNGQKMPMVPDGEPPSTAISINNVKNINATIYLGLNVVGIYIVPPFDPLANLSLPILAADGVKQWGSFTSFPASTVGGTDGAFFLVVKIPSEVSNIIQDHLGI